MALVKRALTKDTHHLDQPLKQPDDVENAKRKKRASREDENYKHEDKIFMLQKKRVLGPPPNTNARQHIGRQNSEDQDDETLIRETQAALKNLSGNWPGGSIYKISDQDENPTFQNLFEEKNNGGRKMSPTISTTISNENMIDSHQYKDEYIFKDFNGKCRSDLKNFHKCRRDKDDFMMAQQQQQHRHKEKHPVSHYQPHDFTELVDDSSNELHIDIASTNGNKDENGLTQHGMPKRDDRTYNLTYSGSRPTFSQSSAFKPIAENRKNGHGLIGPYPTEATFVSYPHECSHSMNGCGENSEGVSDSVCSDKDKIIVKSQIKEEDPSKPVDSPDSKHYTILQPAGVGSKAASVMQDIAREGVVSVAAVSSTSSPGLGSVSSTTVGDKPSYMDRIVPAFSPGSMNRGKPID